MKIKRIKQLSKKDKAFNKRQWDSVDEQHFGKQTDWNSNTFLLKAHDKDTLGFVELRIEGGGVARLQTILVDEASRGKGIGKRLIQEAETIAKENNCHKIYLWTGKNWNERKFYEKLGFEKVADLPNHFFNTDFVIFSKSI